VRSSGGARNEGPRERPPQQAKIEAIDAHGPAGSYQIYFAALTHRHIAIEGPAGVGKTALAERLATRLDAALVVDESANPFDGDAQSGRSGAAFQAQLFRLLTRHRQQSTLKQADLFAQATVSDYLFDKDKIYAYQTLDDNELFIYQRLFELLSADIAPPDLVIYLQAPTDVLRRRIKDRRDARARAASLDRLGELNEAFNHFFFHHTATPLLVVETSQLDLTWPDATLDDLIRQIDGMSRGTRYYVPRG
jgi:deoxyguanosine kinase